MKFEGVRHAAWLTLLGVGRVMARWYGIGGGIVTALAPARWCQSERYPTISMRWKVEGGIQSCHGVGGGDVIFIHLN